MKKHLVSFAEALSSLFKGLRLTHKHLMAAILGKKRKIFETQSETYFSHSTGIETLAYPHDLPTLPDHARHKLHNEIDDCIVCNKCAEICPVDCIEIESVRATEQIGTASDGTPIRIWAAKFDIDMAKCCYCGLCTVVCPTECLTMTPDYDWTTPDLIEMIVPFSNLTPEEAEQKRRELDEYNAKKKQKNTPPKNLSSETAPTQTPEIKLQEPKSQDEKPAQPKKPMFKIKLPPQKS
jgi:formate hydrogenlyase subunit 6/NADH:ubiquinone oxidoreductase subunit I